MIPSGLYCLHSPELYKKPNKQGFSFLIRPQRKDLRILLTKKKIIDLKFFLIQFNDNRLGKNHFYKYIQYCPSFRQYRYSRHQQFFCYEIKTKPQRRSIIASLPKSKQHKRLSDARKREQLVSYKYVGQRDFCEPCPR